MQRMTRRLFVASLAAPALMRASFWDEKSFPDWSPDEVDRLLTDSPWARPTTVRFDLGHPDDGSVFDFSDIQLPPLGGSSGRWGSSGPGWPTGGGQRRGGSDPFPRGGGGSGRGQTVPSEAYLTIRWSSALPIRQALLLEQYGSASEIPADAMAALDQKPEDYVIEIFGIPSLIVRDRAEKFEEAFRNSAELLGPASQKMTATYVRMPSHGYYLAATFRFPRHAGDAAATKEAEFYTAAGRMEIRQSFKLKSMMYHGQLAV